MPTYPKKYVSSIRKILARAKRRGWDFQPLDISEGFEAKELKAAEKKLKIKFPRDYVNFVTNHNSKIWFSVAMSDDDAEKIQVPTPSLYSQMINEYQTEQDESSAINYMAFGWDFVFPEWTVQKTRDFFDDLDIKQKPLWVGRIPIMENGDGNILLLDCSDKASRAGVFFWDHEVHNLPVRLTKTFSDFMNAWERVGFIDLYKLVDQFYVPKKDLLDINCAWGRKLTTTLFGSR